MATDEPTETPSVVELALTEPERALVVRAVHELVEREGPSPAINLRVLAALGAE